MQNSCVLLRSGNLSFEQLAVPDLTPNQVLVRMAKVGLCGSDLSLVYKGQMADLTLPVTSVIGVGHESSGVIAKCGSAVKHLKPGDRVTIEPGNSCRNCDLCLSNKYNLCDKSSFHNNGALYPGMLAHYYTSTADLCFKLPDNVSEEEGALIEPLAVAVHACRQANVELGLPVLICGAGPIGLLCLLTAKAMGATNILVTDIKDNRLKVAKIMGADHTLLVKGSDPKSLAKKVVEVMGCMPNVTLECSGVQSSVTTGIYATKSGGILMLVGIGGTDMTLPITHAAVREISIKGVYRYLNCYPIAIDMIAKGLINVKPLITHRFKLNEFQKAFDMFHTGEDGAIKCIISCE
ncbi:sorbitol dehydrogenase-like [Homarus americanus]|uniref:Sorbitol dehydrogenase n=1 Tax=Homarus americanus TaxID=6706 RepID=A0A8J5NBL3_HOMAM|nr:sorbitol dehydrogenase-like [Homarus americanus]KAG7176995.1 Sorbitol dehydrogenase-like 1 [Homarus americanus]